MQKGTRLNCCGRYAPNLFNCCVPTAVNGAQHLSAVTSGSTSAQSIDFYESAVTVLHLAMQPLHCKVFMQTMDVYFLVIRLLCLCTLSFEGEVSI